MKEAKTPSLERALLFLEKFLMYFSVAVIFSMMFVVAFGVVMRYVFRTPILQVNDLSSFMMVALAYLPIAYIQREGRHVTVDILVSRWSPRTKTIMGLVVTLFALATFLIVAWAGIGAAGRALELGFRSEDSRIPLFGPKLLIPIGAILMCLQLLADFYHGMVALRTAGWKKPEGS